MKLLDAEKLCEFLRPDKKNIYAPMPYKVYQDTKTQEFWVMNLKAKQVIDPNSVQGWQNFTGGLYA